MSKSSYLGANVETSNSFGGWIDKTNQVRHDMGTVVVTVNDVAQPNTTNGAQTSGNAHVEGIFSATTLSAATALTGGTVSVPAILSITSNAEFTSTNGTIDVTSSINLFTVDANNVVVSSNVVFDGGATKIFKIDAANTTINTGSFYVKSNTYITAASFNANVDIMTVGFSAADTLNVNAISDFNANVNIDGILTSDVVFSNVMNVNTQANTASLMVRDLTATRVPFVSTGGEIVDSANFVFNSANSTFAVTGNTTVSANLSVTNGLEVGGNQSFVGIATFANNVTITGDLTVSGNTSFASDVQFSANDSTATTSSVSSLFTSSGNTVLGDTEYDIVTLNAKVVNDIIPSANNTYNIGSATAIYDTVYAENLVGNVAWSSVTSKPDPVITVTLSGDVVGTGSATLTDLASGSISFATSIQTLSVALGTDTTGNYMSGVTAGGGITVTHTPGEGSSATIAHTDTSSATSLAVSQLNGNVLQNLSTTIDTFGHVTAISSASINLDNRYPQVTFKTITVDDTDTEYTWAETGSAVADGLTDTLTLVSGADINVDVDATSDAIRVKNTSTLSTVTGRGATTGSAISITNTTDAASTVTGALKVSGGVGIAKKLYVGTTMNVTGAATFANTASFANNVTIAGDLTINGTTTAYNSTTVTYDDKNIELGSISSPSDAGANGGGITLKGTTDKTFNWVDATDAWSSSEHLNLVTGKAYYINGNSVLNSTTLGSGVTASSLTSVGTLSTGTWSASKIAVNKGGTGQTSYTNGQLLIGNTTGNTLSKATLTAGSNVTITNGPGSITIAAGNPTTNLSATAGTTAGPVINSSSGTNVTIPSASATASGIVTTGTQTFAGAKTFSTTVSAPTFNATSTTNGGFQGIDADSITLPSFTWTSDQNTGMWHAADDSIGFTTGGTNRMTVSSAGINIVGAIVASGNITAYSDERLKSDIKTIDNALYTVKKLRGVTFVKDEERGLGVIAQEVQKVLPELVHDGGDYLSVAYGNMVGLLIEAVKEQQTQIDQLKKDIEELKV